MRALLAPADVAARRVAAVGMSLVTMRLRQSPGMRWVVDVDEALAAVGGACDGSVPVRHAAKVPAASLGRSEDEVAAATDAVLCELVYRGFVVPRTSGGTQS